MSGRVQSLVARLARPTPVPLMVRGGVFLAMLTAFVLAYPVELLAGRVLGLLVIVAALPACWPRRVWPTAAPLLAVVGWVLSTSGFDESISLWRLLGLAGSLYVGHSLSALAAALPYDAAVDVEVVARWLLRALGVVLASAMLMILLRRVAVEGDDTFWIAGPAGLAAAVGAAALLARMARRS